MTIVLTNDDGIDAPGLHTLEVSCRDLAVDLIVVAPREDHSGCGQVVTERATLTVDQRDATHYSVDGTPADCARLALKEIVPEADWLLAGINSGANLGYSVFASGTTCAAREAAYLGTASMAVSQAKTGEIWLAWDRTGWRAAPVIAELIGRKPEAGFWNVNLPADVADGAHPGVVHCDRDPSAMDVRYEREGTSYRYSGVFSERPREPGTDVERCFSGSITVTFERL